jgi:hypothetical protein
MKSFIRLAGVLYLILVTTGCDIQVGEGGGVSVALGGRVSDEWKRTYSLSAGGRFEVFCANGVIEAVAASGPQVEVVAHREIRAKTNEAAHELLDKVQMVEEVTPDRVKIEHKGDGAAARHQVNIRYRIELPPGLTVSLRTESGMVRLEHVQGRISVASTNGPIFGQELSGSLEATTVNGGIQVGMTSISADSKMVTVNGPVTLALARDVKADLDASVVNGGIVVRDELSLNVSEQSVKRVVGRMNGGGPRIVVQTTNGGVRVSSLDDPGPGRRGLRGRGSTGRGSTGG